MRDARRLLPAALALAAAVCALAGAWAAVRIAGPATYESSVGDVHLTVSVSSPQRRGLELYVPLADWGLRARVTGAPVRLAAEPRRIDRTGLTRTVTTGGDEQLRELRAQLDDALTAAGLRAGLLSVAGGVAGGLLAALIWHALGVRGARRLVLAPAGGALLTVVLAGGLAAWTVATWAPQRLERPEYYASGVELQRLLDQAAQLRRAGERYRDRVDVAIRSIAGLIGDRGDPDVAGGATRVVAASDIHDNLLTLPALRRFSAGHPVVLSGDFSINGSRIESGLLRGLSGLGDPVIAVSGNHDSRGLMRSLARGGAHVLMHAGELGADGQVRGPAVRELAGVRWAGFEDPFEYDGGEFPRGIRAALSFGDFPDSRERFRAAVLERWEWWLALPERPDVLVVHQMGLARALAHLIWDDDPDGPPLTIVTGHTHDQALERIGPVTVVNSGSAGAGGLFGAGRDAVGLALLDFARDGRLEATDLVQMDPVTSAARARRVITATPDCDGELVICAGEPEPPDLVGPPQASTAGAPVE